MSRFLFFLLGSTAIEELVLEQLVEWPDLRTRGKGSATRREDRVELPRAGVRTRA